MRAQLECAILLATRGGGAAGGSEGSLALGSEHKHLLLSHRQLDDPQLAAAKHLLQLAVDVRLVVEDRVQLAHSGHLELVGASGRALKEESERRFEVRRNSQLIVVESVRSARRRTTSRHPLPDGRNQFVVLPSQMYSLEDLSG